MRGSLSFRKKASLVVNLIVILFVGIAPLSLAPSVPEPGKVMFLGVGLLGLSIWGKKRLKRDQDRPEQRDFLGQSAPFSESANFQSSPSRVEASAVCGSFPVPQTGGVQHL